MDTLGRVGQFDFTDFSGRSSKIYSIPLPMEHGNSAAVYSTETFHVAHGRWETRAPIQSFIPVQENGKTYIVGSFSCTPIAKFPVDGLEDGAKVKGTSIVELGSGNRPIDMFIYNKDGKDSTTNDDPSDPASTGAAEWT